MIALRELGEAIAGVDFQTSPRECLTELLRLICERVGYHYGTVIEIDDHGQGNMIASYNLPANYPELVAKVNAPVLSSPSGEAIKTGQIVVIQDPLSDPRLGPWEILIRAHQLETIIWVPLQSGQQVIGTFNLYDTKRRMISADELQLLERVAGMFSIAAVSVQHLDRLHRQSEELRAEIAERKRIESELKEARDKLEERVKERTIVLEEVNRKLIREIAERERAEEEREQAHRQLQQSQKLEAIGRLAGGVAHEINNMLLGIMSYVSLIQLNLEADGSEFKDTEEIINICKRARDLTNNLLGFARKGKYRKEIIDINESIRNVSEFLKRTISRNIVVENQLQPEPIMIEGDLGQIEQVLMNLFINAVDAMPDGGVLKISTGEVLKEKTTADELSELGSDRCVEIEISDTGMGMDDQTIEQAFEPFYTTKAEGTGMGLPMVFGTVRNHRGQVLLDSELGRGTTVRVLIPTCSPASEQEQPKESEQFNVAPIHIDRPVDKPTILVVDRPVDKPTILVVDDEEIVRNTTQRLLERMGYQVLMASDGKQALEIFEGKPKEISLVLLDIVMPIMAGPETLRKLKEIDPDVRVLLFSGFSTNGKAENMLEQGALGFIPKPFMPNQLADEVAKAIATS